MTNKTITSVILALAILVILIITRQVSTELREVLLGFLVSYAVSYTIIIVVLPDRSKHVVAFDVGGVLTSGDYYTEKLRENKDTMALVDRLKKKSNRVAILSNQNAEAYRVFEKKFKYDRIFDDQIVSGRVGVKKPDPRIYSFTMQKLGVEPNKLVFVDDQDENVAAAKKMGISAIKFKSAQQLEQDLKKLGVDI